MLDAKIITGVMFGSAGQHLLLAIYSPWPVSLEYGFAGVGLTLTALGLLWLSGRGRGVPEQENICEREIPLSLSHLPIAVSPDPSSMFIDDTYIRWSERAIIAEAYQMTGNRLSRRSLFAVGKGRISEARAAEIIEALNQIGVSGTKYAERKSDNSPTYLLDAALQVLQLKPTPSPACQSRKLQRFTD